MIAYLLLIVSILFAVINNAFYHKLSDEGEYNHFLFTAVSSLVWVFILSPNGNISEVQCIEVVFGVLFGIVQAMFLFFKMRAMSSGPVSITSVVGNCSMLLVTVMGVFLFHECVNIVQVIGICAIIASIILCVDPKSDMKMTVRWKMNCIFFFAFATALSIIQKIFSKTTGSGSNMMMITAIVMVLILFLLSLCSKEKLILTKRQIGYALVCGIFSCGYNRLNIYLSGVLPTAVFYPIFNGALVLLTTIIGGTVFREHFSKKQLIGIITGIIAIILIGVIF